jgi:hypothetical protein
MNLLSITQDVPVGQELTTGAIGGTLLLDTIRLKGGAVFVSADGKFI